MDMLDIRQLEAFCTVMQHHSVTRAAQILGISQPAVSALLNKLEEAVGYALFLREHRRLTPTPEAELLFAEVAIVLERHTRLTRIAHEIHEARAGSLSIASHPGPSISWLPVLIAAFIAERPGVTVKLISRQSKGIRELVPTGAFDLALAELPVEHQLNLMRRYRLHFVAVISASSPLASHKVLTPALLNDYPFIAMFRGHAAQRGVTQAFEDANCKLRVVVECDYFASAIALAKQGVGVALVDPLSALDLASDRIVVRRFEPTIPYDFALLHPADRAPSRLALSFAATFEKHMKNFSGK
jgi:DNA-binding transcriptional LysR family regulator